MKYSSEIKVGFAIVLAGLIFFFGVRYMQDMPLFRGSYTLETELENASGLTSGNRVEINGVNVGSVESVRLDPGARMARVRFRVDRDVEIPEGSTVAVQGMSALGGVRLNVKMGPEDNPRIEPGGFVPSDPDADILDQLSDQVPGLAAELDSLLKTTNRTMRETGAMVESPDSDLRTTLRAIRGTAESLDETIQSERGRLGRALESTADLTEELSAISEEGGDSLRVASGHLNRVLTQTNRNLEAIEEATENLDRLIMKLEQGDGTAGRMMNDPSLYIQLDSAATRMNSILDDFEENPGRYLRDMNLVRLF